MNRLEAWAASGLIELLIPEPAYNEALVGENDKRTTKAMTYIQSLTHADNPDEVAMIARLGGILFPNGIRNDGDRHDVEIVFNAQKYGGRLVTADGGSRRQPGGILGAAAALAVLDIRVMTDAEACALVEDHLVRRDQIAREWAAYTGNPVPAWVGTDR